MVDKNNLKRIKGILSARQGAEIPKFQNPAGPITYTVRAGDTLSKIVAEHNARNGTNYSLQDVASWNNLADPNKIQVGQVLNLANTQQPATAIPGDPKITPTTAVETAADIQEKANINQQEFEAGKRYEQVVLSAEAKENATATLNGSLTPVSAGMKIDEGIQAKRVAKAERQQKWTNVGNAMGAASSAALTAVGGAFAAKQQETDSNLTKTVDTTYSGIAEAAKSMGPIGEAVGGIMNIAKGAGDIIQELGGGTDQQTKTDKWMDSAFFSWNIGMINGFAGKNTQEFGVDTETLAAVGSSYGGTSDAITDAAKKAGKKYGLFSSKERKKADAAIDKARVKQNLMSDVADTASDQRLAAQSMGEQAGLAYSMMTSGGYDQKHTYTAKQGGILNWEPQIELEWEPQVELNWELPTFKEGGNIDINEELEWIPEFKNGGKTEDSNIPEIEETTQKNVIPEGALHKNKHHMEHAEGLTKKGIPVIDDDGEQQAEIEHSEIIFTLEVTKKLEEYYKIFYSDEASNKEKEQAALEAGKLLVYQILENTEDRTGLIDSCKKGGTLTLKKTADDLIEETLEDVSAIVIVEEEIINTPKKKEEKSDKELMKEAIKEALIELILK